MTHGTADSEPTVTLKVSELEGVVKRVNALFLDKLYAHDPSHPFCRIAQEKGEWAAPTDNGLASAGRPTTQRTIDATTPASKSGEEV